MKRTTLFIALLAAANLAGAAPWTYRGTLNDGGKPANGTYDVRLTLANAAGTASVSQPITVFNVPVKDGSFSAEVDFGMDLANAPAMKLKTEVGQSGSGFVSLGEPSTFDPKAALAVGACWSSTGDNGSNPTLNFLGNTDAQTMVISSPSGVSLNKRAQIVDFAVDLLVAPKVNGDSDADIRLQTRTGKEGLIYTKETTGDLAINSAPNTGGTGILEFRGADGAASSGAPMALFRGRIQSNAGDANPASPGGGMWLGSEAGATSYMGRGNNQDNYSGFWHDGIWRMVISENGTAMFNVTTPTDVGVDVEFAAKPAPADPDTDIVLRTRSNKRGRFYLLDSTGGFWFDNPGLTAGSPRISAGGATLSNGGTWTNASSRTLKEGFFAVNPIEILYKLTAMPITTWSYIGSGEGTHMGPVAEDFKASFGLAGDGKSIGTVDADGVALAAIQGLNQKLESENAALKARLDAIEAKLAD